MERLYSLGSIGVRAVAVWLVGVLSAVIIKAYFFTPVEHIKDVASTIDSLGFAVLTFVAAAYGIKEAAKATVEKERIRQNPTLPNPEQEVQGAG